MSFEPGPLWAFINFEDVSNGIINLTRFGDIDRCLWPITDGRLLIHGEVACLGDYA